MQGSIQGIRIAPLTASPDAATASAKYENKNPRVTIGERVIIGEGTVIEDGVMIKGPAIIGRNCELRHNAYIRDYVLIFARKG